MRRYVGACLVVTALLPLTVACAGDAPPPDMDAATRALASALAAGDIEKARGIADETCSQARNSPAAAALRAKVHAFERHWTDVDAVMKEALQKASDADDRRRGYVAWARVYVWDIHLDLPPRPADFVRIALAAEEALSGDPKLVEGLAHAARDLLVIRDGQSPAARDVETVSRWLSALAERHPEKGWVHVALGWLNTRFLLNQAAAVASLSRAARLEPDTARSKQIFLDWGEALLRQRDGVEAERVLRLALKKKQIFGIDDGAIMADIALAQVLRGDFQGAAASCDESLAWAQERHGEDFEYETAACLANILRLRSGGEFEEMSKAVGEFADFEAGDSQSEREDLEALLLAALEPHTAWQCYTILAAGGGVVLLLGALLARLVIMRRRATIKGV